VILMAAQLDVFLPLPLTNRGPGYTCGVLAQGMAGSELNVTIVTPRARAQPVFPADIVQVLPHWARYVPYRWVRSRAKDTIEAAFLSQTGVPRTSPHGAYIWPDASLETVIKLKRSNITVFREMINCHRGTAKVILDDAYARIGAPPRHTITDVSVIAEQQMLEAVDYIFCPNQMVEDSLLAHGLPASKYISTSYGWDPARFRGSKALLGPYDGMTAVFAGTICVRKGCHLLLDYWAQSNTRGRLILAGALEETIKEKCADLLARDNVVVIDFVPDVGALYRTADVFVFPSLEEGGPQVTYEACGCGLPVITTPMGAGRIVRQNQEGFVLDPYDREGWITAIRTLAADHDRRRAMGLAAARRAQSFVWNTVALRRRHQILDHLSNGHDDPQRPTTAHNPHDLDWHDIQ
jgi:glycosyltransferase involved in cell wall biosynthesis